MRKRAMAAFSAGAVLAFCGCDGGGGGTSDVTGKWDFYSTQDGVPGETGPDLGHIVQTGSQITVDVDGDVATGTVSGASVSYTISNALATITSTGTVSGGHMEGSWQGTALGQPVSGTWRAELASRAIVDVSGNWSIDWTESGGLSGTAAAALTMAADGTITGTYDPGYGPAVAVTGRLHGYALTLTVEESDRTIVIDATVAATGTSASGTWFDSDGYSGGWEATMP